MVLMNHGIFSFGDNARQSYERMIELVGRAEDYLKAQRAWDIAAPCVSPARIEMLAASAAAPQIVGRRGRAHDHGDPCRRRDAWPSPSAQTYAQLSQQGPITPDHVIRTKRLPMLGVDVDAYVRRLPDLLR